VDAATLNPIWTVSGAGSCTINSITYHTLANSIKLNIPGGTTTVEQILASRTAGHSLVFVAFFYKFYGATATCKVAIILNGNTSYLPQGDGTEWPWYQTGKARAATIGVSFSAAINVQNGAGAACYVYLDEIAFGDAYVQINGLLDNQIAKFYGYNGSLAFTTSGSVGGLIKDTLTDAACALLPFTKVEITDTDGSTIIYSTTTFTDIFGGDVFTAQVAQAPRLNPSRIQPPNMMTPRAYLRTKHHAYTGASTATVSPPAAGALGAFRFILPDKGQTLEKQFTFETWPRCWIGGKLGLKRDIILEGIVERTMPIELGNGQMGLEVVGRSCGAYADRRSATTTTTFGPAEISTIVKALAAYVPELQVGPYVYSTGKTYTLTWVRGRSVWDAWKELAAAASMSQLPWAVWDCRGEHPGETGPGIHFAPATQTVSTIPILKGNFAELIAPRDTKQILTNTIIAYNNAGTIAYLVSDAVGPGELSNYAFIFDGSTTYVTVPYSTLEDFTAGAEFSFEACIYPTSVAGAGSIACKGRTSAVLARSNWNIRRNGTELDFYYSKSGDDAVTHVYTTSGAALAVNTWYYVLVSWTVGTGSSMEIYLGTVLNGSPVFKRLLGSWTTGNGDDTPVNDTTTVYLGATNVGGALSQQYAGRMDNWRLFRRRIYASEGLERFQGILNRGGSVLELLFEAGAGTTITDTSGNGLNGTASGTVAWYANAYTPNSQNRFGSVPYFEDRSYAGLTEALALSSILLWRGRQPTRYVEAHLPLDLRRKAGQYTLILAPAFRGRANIEDLKHVIHDAETIVTLAYR